MEEIRSFLFSSFSCSERICSLRTAICPSMLSFKRMDFECSSLVEAIFSSEAEFSSSSLSKSFFSCSDWLEAFSQSPFTIEVF